MFNFKVIIEKLSQGIYYMKLTCLILLLCENVMASNVYDSETGVLHISSIKHNGSIFSVNMRNQGDFVFKVESVDPVIDETDFSLLDDFNSETGMLHLQKVLVGAHIYEVSMRYRLDTMFGMVSATSSLGSERKDLLQMTQYYNEGALCVYAKKNNDLAIYHYPLGREGCESSTLVKWENRKLSTGLSHSTKSMLLINSLATRIRRYSRVSTPDCGTMGGIQIVRIERPSVKSLEVKWGDVSFGNIDFSQQSIACKNIDGSGKVLKTNPYLEDKVIQSEEWHDRFQPLLGKRKDLN